uniref:RAD50-interacting protein 1 n=1 Tax=Panagrolaimus sp. JU765 TaxID=591449 RepID=A0AC34RHG4_9BILA
MAEKDANKLELLEFTERLAKLKTDNLATFFMEFDKIYQDVMERKQTLEEEVLVEEEKIPEMKKQIRENLEKIEVAKKELIEAGDETTKMLLNGREKLAKELPEVAKTLDKILVQKKDLKILLFSKEFRTLNEKCKLMIDSKSFAEFRNCFEQLSKLSETSENFVFEIEKSFKKEFENKRMFFVKLLKKVLFDKFTSLKFPFEMAVDYQFVKPELEFITEILHCLHVLFKFGEDEETILQIVFEEFVKRFHFHFYGDKPTNSDSKPEWFFAEISAWISANIPFMEGHLQPLFIEIGEAEVLVTEEFIESLVRLASEKVHLMLSKPKFVNDYRLLSHLVDETVIFEKELSDVYLYPESSPHVISELCQDDVLQHWMRMEENTISVGIDSILSDPNAYENRFKDAVDVDEHLVPNFADAFVILMQAMTERYRSIPDDRIQCKFLKLQLVIFDEFRSQMVAISQALDTPLTKPNPQLLNAFWYISTVMDEWSASSEFIRLQSFLQNGPLPIKGTFDEQSGLYKHFWRQKARELTQYFAFLIAEELDVYSRIRWSKIENPKPTEISPQFLPFLSKVKELIEKLNEEISIRWSKIENPKPTEISPQFLSFLSKVKELIEKLNEEISSTSVTTLYLLTNDEIWNVLEKIVSQTNFHYRGAAQMLFDFTSGLIPTLEAVYHWPKTTVANGILSLKCVEVLNTLKLLSLPSPTAVLLKEEVIRNPEQMLEEKLEPFHVSGLTKQRVLEIFQQRCDMNLMI